MSVALPDPTQRWRCGGCGNLTRFDLTRTRRTTEYWHVDLAGDPVVEETEVLEESVQSVTCRWCGRSDAIELVARADVAGDADPAQDTDT
jgi:hypothetical protein